MKIAVVSARPWEVRADVVAIQVGFEGLADDAAELNRRLEGAIVNYLEIGELRGAVNASVMLRGRDIAASWVLAVGARTPRIDRIAALRFGASIERRLAGIRVRDLAICLPPIEGTEVGVGSIVELLVRGVVEGSYDPRSIYLDDDGDRPPQLDSLTIVVSGTDLAPLERAASRGRTIGEGANRARTLAQRASNDLTPEVMADEATTIARENDLQIDILGPERAAEMNLNLFLAVGRGSDNPPRFIVLRNQPPETYGRSQLVALVGKGVTFDSGGISLKPALRMEEMKMDKTGAATVISAIATAKALAPDIPLVAIAPIVENMPGPHSTRPGDIIRGLTGKLVEINNTDAEGRLILADALAFAEREGATHVIDVATLDGITGQAFGGQVAGVFTNSQPLWRLIESAGEDQGERYAQVPLVDDYRSDMNSWYADLRNGYPDRRGALAMGAMFLREFVTRPWAHIDVAGTAWLREPTAWAAVGATGTTHATLVELVTKQMNLA